MTQSEWIIIIVGIILSVGGFLVTCIVGLIAFLMKRLTRSVDEIKKVTEQFAIQLARTPSLKDAELLSQKVAESFIILHERDHHSIKED